MQDVVEDLLREREGYVATLTDCYGSMGDAEYVPAQEAFMEGMAEPCKILKTKENALKNNVAADKILTREKYCLSFNQIVEDNIRVTIAQSGRKPRNKDNRGLDTFEDILKWYDGKLYSTHSRKVAVHMQTQNR